MERAWQRPTAVLLPTAQTDMNIELLSPARDADTGIAAVNHGADAVYIGGPRFGARAAAGNSLSELERLIRHAHRYRARIFVTLNTILSDDELEGAVHMAEDLWRIGTDAFIVQDMALLTLPLPPVPLHASTQTDNRTPEKVRFLHAAGFDRVVLARELPLEDIAAIHAACPVELEAFVHGALCVSYSGQCWLSHAMTGRSANRGACAQPCRLPWSLQDASGNVLVRDRHLLSLRDMDRSAHLREMISAGVTSFKIEGRLKDMAYVKNITAWYRQRLDAILGSDGLRAASSGRTVFHFVPDPARTFHRGSTDYFLHGRTEDMACHDTPKSIGAPLGTLLRVSPRGLDIRSSQPIANGDGLCQGAVGFRVNRAEQTGADLWRVYPAAGGEWRQLQPGHPVRRNADTAFLKLLEGESASRKIAISLVFSEAANGFLLSATDEDGVEVAVPCASDKVPAQKPERAEAMVRDRLSHWGDTMYKVADCAVRWSQAFFIPSGQLSAWRRAAEAALDEAREAAWHRVLRSSVPWSADRRDVPPVFPQDGGTASYRANILNGRAADFYRQCGVVHIEAALESAVPLPAFADVPHGEHRVLMTCRYCIRHALGWCTKNKKRPPSGEPLYLCYHDKRFRLVFDCKRCEMQVLS